MWILKKVSAQLILLECSVLIQALYWGNCWFSLVSVYRGKCESVLMKWNLGYKHEVMVSTVYDKRCQKP